MLFKVTNNTTGPRAVYHGESMVRSTHVPPGQTRTVEMTQAEAENAKVPGLDIEAVDPSELKPLAVRLFLAMADDAEGGGLTLIELPADKFVGIAVDTTRPADASGYQWSPVVHEMEFTFEQELEDDVYASKEEVDPPAGEESELAPAGDASEPGPASEAPAAGDASGPETAASTEAGAPGPDSLTGEAGNDSLTGGQGADDQEGPATEAAPAGDAYPNLSAKQEAALDRIPDDGKTKPGGAPKGGNHKSAAKAKE